MEPSEEVDYICPNCSQPVRVTPTSEAQLYACPACASEFVVAGADGSTDPSVPQQREEPADRSDELDGIRIRQLSQAKRAANRARSFCLIGVLFCSVAAVQLSITVARDMLAGQNSWKTSIYTLISIGLLILTFVLFKKSRQLHAEVKRTTLIAPDRPPDFSSLDDGNRRWKDLDELH